MSTYVDRQIERPKPNSVDATAESRVTDRTPRPVRVLVVGQTPPPFGGQAMMIERLVNGSLPGVQIFHVRMAFSKTMGEMGRFRFSKLVHLAAVIVRIIFTRIFRRTKILYYPPAGPNRLPMIRDLVILLCTRWLFQKTIFHFRAGGLSEQYGDLSRLGRWLFRMAYFNPDASIRLSTHSPQDGRALRSQRDYVVLNGIEDRYLEVSANLMPAITTETQPVRVLFVGVLCESKGVLDLLDACGRLTKQDLQLSIELMGEFQSEEFRSTVIAKMAELGIESQVSFLGVLTGQEKHRRFLSADIFCLPTFFESESTPSVLLEAMSFEIPVVATRWRGVPAMVEDGQTGFLVEPHDLPTLAEKLARLSLDADLRDRMGTAGRRKFLKEFTIDRHLAQMAHVFWEVAAGNPPQREHGKIGARSSAHKRTTTWNVQTVGTDR